MSQPKERTLFFAIMIGSLLLAFSCQAEIYRAQEIHPPNLKKSFPLRQGRFSALTSITADKEGFVFASGFSDGNCILLKMDAELKTLIKMVRFGSTKSRGYFSQDTIKDMEIDSKGNIFVTGYTQNQDFPVTKDSYSYLSPDDSNSWDWQGFVTKFSPDLRMLASSVIGSETNEKFHAITIDHDDNIYLAGYSEGTDSKYRQAFTPPAKAFDKIPGPGGQSKALVIKLSNDLSTLLGATLLGGQENNYKADTQAFAIALDNQGNLLVTGQTKSNNFPVTYGSIGQNLAGESDIFVTKLDPNLNTLLASTYLGGRKKEQANTIVIDEQNNIFIGGWSESSDLLVFSKGYNTQHSGNEEDAFIFKLDSNLENILAATLLGGSPPALLEGKKTRQEGDDKLSSMVLSEDGQTLYVVGRTESKNFTTTPPSQVNHSGNMVLNITLNRSKGTDDDSDYGSGFIARFDSSLETCISSNLFGGTSLDYFDDLLLTDHHLYMVGETNSTDFPGMPINYTISGTRGFLTLLDKEISKKFMVKNPMNFTPQFTDAEIKQISESLTKKIKTHFNSQDIYSLLGRHGKKRTSRKNFEARFQRSLHLYGKPLSLGIKFHHYNYFQNGIKGYDVIDICFVEQNIPNPYYLTNPNGGRIIVTIIAKNKKWQVADINYRGFSSETSRMSRRLH